MITIRFESSQDIPAIRRVHEEAFAGPEEAEVVERLRERGIDTLPLVALKDGQVVGHILFSPVTIESEPSSVRAVGLGPMAVLPDYQRQGIGSQLVRVGLDECRKAGQEVAVVVGHTWFYPRFGFVPAREFGLCWDQGDPGDAFMVIELRLGALGTRGGTVRYLPEFTSV